MRHFALVLLLFVGCASPISLLSKPDTVTFQTSKSVDQVTEAIAGAWAKEMTGTTVIPSEGGKTLYFTSGLGAVDISVRVWTENGKTWVKYGMRLRALSPAWEEAPLLKLRQEQ